jgi:hypothetical protein
MKNCTNCGKGNMDEAVFCASCGTPLPTSEVQQAASPIVTETPAPVVTETPVPVQTVEGSAYSAPVAPAAPAESNKATLWLILNIVATVLCCCANIFGIVGIIFAGIGMSSYKKGDYEDMNKKSKLAMIMFIIAAVSVVIGWIIAIVSPLLASLPFLSSLSY